MRGRSEDAKIKKIKSALEKRPPYRDEKLAPRVDHDLLLALVRKQLPDQTARDVYLLVESFKSWSDAYCELLAREFRETNTQSRRKHDEHMLRNGRSRKPSR